MMSRTFASVLFFVGVLALAECRIYTNCEVMNALQNNGIPTEQLSTWVCIASHESGFNTQAINGDTGDYGIFQISHLYWCSDGDTPGNGCGITCNSLLGDDITEDIACIKTVFAVTESQGSYGFTAWTTYQYCSGDNSAYIAGC